MSACLFLTRILVANQNQALLSSLYCTRQIKASNGAASQPPTAADDRHQIPIQAGEKGSNAMHTLVYKLAIHQADKMQPVHTQTAKYHNGVIV